MPQRHRLGSLRQLIVIVTLSVSACGGGGGGGGDPSPAPAPAPAPTPPPTPPPAPANSPPIVALPNDTVRGGVAGHAFRYDASQGGRTFSDPDGDPLTYTVTVFTSANPPAVDGAAIALTLPPVGGSLAARIEARDGRGGSAVDVFAIEFGNNRPPTIVRPNGAVFTPVGTHVNRDLTQGGTTFVDPEGDSITYTARMTSPAGRGFVLDTLNAVGALVSEPSVASFAITADDGHGGTTTDAFAVAIAAPPPGRPTLPAQRYAYADEDLALPFFYSVARETLSPFWDTATTQGKPPSNAGATLGRVLFYDKRLSITNTHSCGSCHSQSLGFTTTERFPRGVLGVPLERNAMALANARYNFPERYFGDMRAPSLESAARLCIQDPMKLGNLLPVATERLAATDFYPALFEAAFESREITSEGIADALGEFLRSIVSYRTRFDQAFAPLEDPVIVPPPVPAQVLTPLEIQGANLFEAALCSECHSTDLQTMDFASNNGLDVVPTDLGIGGGAFRSASLRNIAVTAPYMHDGRFATLREVIEHYDHGVADTPALAIELRANGDGPPRRLNLTAAQKDDLEAFLRTLTDHALLADPKFSDPF